MKLWRWLIILAPTFLGTSLAVFFFLEYDQSHDHIVYLRADLGTLSFLIGLLLSLVAALVFSLRFWTQRIHLRASSIAAEERLSFPAPP